MTGGRDAAGVASGCGERAARAGAAVVARVLRGPPREGRQGFCQGARASGGADSRRKARKSADGAADAADGAGARGAKAPGGRQGDGARRRRGAAWHAEAPARHGPRARAPAQAPAEEGGAAGGFPGRQRRGPGAGATLLLRYLCHICRGAPL